MKYTIRHVELELLPERAVFWREKRMLIVADAHIGKVSHFRKNGIPVPRMAERNNLWRLSGLVMKTKPETVVFLGDLTHSKHNKAWEQFIDFRKVYEEVEMILIKGNHDILPPEALHRAEISVMHQMSVGPFLLTHDKEETELYNLYGHVHPAIKLRGRGRQSLKVPCFFFGENYGILPSFGDFTGSYALKPKGGDTVFVPGEKETLKVF